MQGNPPAVIWLTGLSGAGKSTIAELVCAELEALGLPVERLDGDALRRLSPELGFSRADRDEHVRRTGRLASALEREGKFVVASLISPYRESRRYAREQCRRWLEVHVATPLEECERRDPKGLYARARRGELRGFTGIDDPYEAPLDAALVLDTSSLSAREAARLVIAKLGALREGTHGSA